MVWRGPLIRTTLTATNQTNTGAEPTMSGSRPMGPLFPVPPKMASPAIRSSTAHTPLNQASQRGSIPARSTA